MAASRLTVGILPGIELEIGGDATAIHHFSAEYATGPAAASQDVPTTRRLSVTFVERMPADCRTDGHRTVHWQARLNRAGPGTLSLEIALRGWPRWFGLSLVQGYLMEPALSLLVAETGSVLLPAAGIVSDSRVDLLIGRSGSGKSSLSMRALAAGLPILGDDQVHVARDGTCTPFPRRLRVYSDLSATAPQAFRRLFRAQRTALRIRRIVRLLTRGRVAPSLAIDLRPFAAPVPASPLRIHRIVLLRRDDAIDSTQVRSGDLGHALSMSVEVLGDQRRRLGRVLGREWEDELLLGLTREKEALEGAFASVPIVAVDVANSHDPDMGMGQLAAQLGLP